MSDEQRPGAGYRGALPPRGDRLAAPWVVIVIVIFVLMFVLAFLGLPEGLFPEPTPLPTLQPTATPSASLGSVAPTGSPSP